MFSTLRGSRPVYANFLIQQRKLIVLHRCGFSTRSVKNVPKLPVQGFKFKVTECYNVPAKIRIQNREFHTTKRLDIPPLLALLLRPVLRVGSFVFGRTIRKWWRKKDPAERERIAAYLRKKKPYFYGTIGAIFSVLVVYYLTHIESTPITNRPRFIMFTNKQEAAFAKLIFETQLELHSDEIVPNIHPTYNQLLAVTNRLLNANKDLPFMKEKQWTLTVVDNPLKNAYVLPGGNIFIFTGILQMVENMDQLSIIIAHEMAHAYLKHTLEQLSNGFIIDVMLALPIILLSAVFPDLVAVALQITGQLFLSLLHDLPYSRALEREADEVGLMLAAKACVDVREAVVFWGLMRSLKELDGEPKEIDWLSTHPNHKDRAKKLDAQMSKAIALRSSYKCPALSPTDPRTEFYKRTAEENEARFKQRGLI